MTSREPRASRSGGASGVGALHERYARAGQGHVFAFWDALDDAGRARLASQAARFDPEAVGRAFRAARARAAQPDRLEPPDVLRLPERGGDPALRERARARGLELLAAGSVAVLVVAGGQGTRLGFEGPKGAFPLGPVSGRTLFAQQAQKLRGARRRSGRPLPWLLMTSDATDAATRALFAAEGLFGLPPGDVRLFSQGTLPCVDVEGRIVLEARDRIAVAPDGHGGVILALAASGLLDELEARGVRLLSYTQVDNPLARLADPLFLGLHDLEGAEMSCKVLAKRTPDERAGTVGRRGGRVHVIEYTEVDPWHRDQPGADGELAFWAGSIAMHVLNVDFVRRVAADAERLLPCHASPKAIPGLDAGRALVARPAQRLQARTFRVRRLARGAPRGAPRGAARRGVLADQEPHGRRVAADGPRGPGRVLPPLARRRGGGGGAGRRLDRARPVGRRRPRRPPRRRRPTGGTRDRVDPLGKSRNHMSPSKKTARKTSKKPARKPATGAARPRPAAKRPAAAKAPAKPAAKKKAAPAPAKKAAAPAPAKKPPVPAPPAAPAPEAKAAARPAPMAKSRPAEVRKPAPRQRARAPIVPDIIKPGLGGRWECFNCSSKFYDLGKPEPICPKCGADQRDKPREKPTPPSPPAEKPRRAAVPMGSLLDDDEEPAEEFEAEEGDLAGLDAEAFLTETPEEEEEEVDVTVLDED